MRYVPGLAPPTKSLIKASSHCNQIFCSGYIRIHFNLYDGEFFDNKIWLVDTLCHAIGDTGPVKKNVQETEYYEGVYCKKLFYSIKCTFT